MNPPAAVLLPSLLLALAGCPTPEAPVDTGSPPVDTAPDGPEDWDGDAFLEPDDCAPLDPEIHPGAWEACDGLDNDCDGLVDELYDLDEDGWMADDPGCRASGWEVDCDDLDASIHPDAEELLNGVDDDCDGATDEGEDRDGDGWDAWTDCDDDDPFTSPGAPEACDGLDNDCDGAFDEDWDEDGDGASPCMGDCDDADPYVSPLMPDTCDGVDNDCDGTVDEDADGDGDGVATCMGDCDDADAAVYPGADEICDDKDNDCDGTVPDRLDGDGDGFTACDGDCDDGNARALPGGTETCDGADNDCNGVADDDASCWSCTSTASSYLVCTTAATWEVAREGCAFFGMDLAIFESPAENATASAEAYAISTDSVWIGLTDEAAEDTWVWCDGSAARTSAWARGQPDNAGNEDCVSTNYSAQGLWNDWPCDTELGFICE